MSAVKSKTASNDADDKLTLTLEEVGCPVCLEVLVEPVTMPCMHRLCKPCFTKNIEMTNLHCPFCKKRLGIWCRRAKKVDALVDQKLWTYLKDNFTSVVNARLNGEATPEIFKVAFSHRICQSGQIGEEFRCQVDELEREAKEREDKDLLKSKALIMKIQEAELRTTSENDSPNKFQSIVCAPPTLNPFTSELNFSDVQNTPCLLSGTEDVGTFFDKDFMNMQRLAEERILQTRQDEELAKKLQEEEAKVHFSTANVTPVTTRNRTPKRRKGPRQLTLEESMNVKRTRLH